MASGLNITKYWLLFILLLGLQGGHGQGSSLKKQKCLALDTFKNHAICIQDSFTIIPESFFITPSHPITDSLEPFIKNNLLCLPQIKHPLGTDSICINYRSLSLNLSTEYATIDTSKSTQKPLSEGYIGYEFNPYKKDNSDKLIRSEGLDYDGSFSRGFSLGNTQSLLLNSNFNMQLSGDLGNDIKIKAAISDDNIPIQPEGNTQVLQEFDRVFIQVERKGLDVIAGDYTLKEDQSHFLNYFKKLKGISSGYTWKTDKSRLSARGSFAQSQGKFARNTLKTLEGNQGPYRLEGNNKELFLIIRSGTERVYLDGKLLTRGLDEDYVISYDRAEITFTQKVLVTKDSRLIVEFEYIDRNYQRTMYATDIQYDYKRLGLKLKLFNEADSKNITADIMLDSTDVKNLMNAGDTRASSSSARPFTDDFDPDLILYALEMDGLDSFYRYTTNPDSADFFVSFSNVGPGLGSYEIDNNSLANGRVYKYVGANKGSFEPIRQLVAPQSKQMIALEATFRVGKTGVLKGELALSNQDLNLFSGLNDSDNRGTAYFLDYSDKIGLKTFKDSSKLSLSLTGRYEKANVDFKPINPYKNSEFSRDWNVNLDTLASEEIALFNIGLIHSKKGALSYQYNQYNRGSFYSGNKHVARYNLLSKNTQIDLKYDQLKSEATEENTDFKRYNNNLSYKIPWLAGLQIGINFNKEENRRSNKSTGLLKATSLGFDEYGFVLHSPEGKKINISLGAKQRIDQKVDPINNQNFKEAFRAEDYFLTGGYSTKRSSLNFDFTYRLLTPNEEISPDVDPAKNLLGRLSYRLSALKKALTFSTTYSVGSGQEAKREFQFAEVEVGEGTHIWIDNDTMPDGIRDPNEFLFSDIGDANYIRISVFNNEFIQTNTQELTQSFRFNLKPLIKNKKGTKFWRFLSRTALHSNLKVLQKTEKTAENTSIALLQFDPNDSLVVRYDGSIANTLYINRSNPKWDAQLTQKQLHNSFTQISGLESRRLKEYGIRLRTSPRKTFDLILIANIQEREQSSEPFPDRNYVIDQFTLFPELSIRPKSNIRFKLNFKRTEKEARDIDGSELQANDFGSELTWRKASISSFTLSLNYVKVKTDVNATTPLGFELLDGLKSGSNFLWNIDITRRLVKNVDLVISYNGRKTGEIAPIHMARAQVKATF